MLLCTQAVLGAASWLGMRSNRFWYIYSATQKSHSNAFDNDLAVSQLAWDYSGQATAIHKCYEGTFSNCINKITAIN